MRTVTCALLHPPSCRCWPGFMELCFIGTALGIVVSAACLVVLGILILRAWFTA